MRDRLFASYHTLVNRLDIDNDRNRNLIFRSFRRTLRNFLPKNKNDSILDVGCGEGYLLAMLKDSGYKKTEGVDISPENIEICHKAKIAEVQLFDIRDIEAYKPGNYYHTIFCLDVLEHIPKSQALEFVEHLRGKLKPKGNLIIQLPNMGSILGVYNFYYDLSHEFALTEKTAITLMRMAGFEEKDITVHPAWNATTLLGYLREIYLVVLHRLIFLAYGANYPKIPTKNLIIKARNQG